MSGYCERVVCAGLTAEAACRCLLDWFKRFGPVPKWASDRGTHFKNQLLELLRKSYGSAHHFTTAYCPWANGTVEVVNRLLLKCLRAMLSELNLHISECPTVLPLVMYIVYRKQREYVAAVQASPENMHRTLTQEAGKRRSQYRDRRANKLSVYWRGPRRVVRALSDYIFEVQDLSVPFQVSQHHASRLRFYAASGQDTTEDFIAQATHGDGEHLVSKPHQCRLGQESHEPATIMFEDVPNLVEKFVMDQPAASTAHVMWKTLSDERPSIN
ncbi:hypothetical protein PHMEG_00024343 [Phytophthora megakarya]|uniref:Integrase catalytic domain-containing protein n=1 Tax=Phytophthora megakarya TaxID=4795 RepID=A0A225VH81_9STRA|nr:hypothetical protein PHMEG_00024343 [Phytophthora megakarya]